MDNLNASHVIYLEKEHKKIKKKLFFKHRIAQNKIILMEYLLLDNAMIMAWGLNKILKKHSIIIMKVPNSIIPVPRLSQVTAIMMAMAHYKILTKLSSITSNLQTMVMQEVYSLLVIVTNLEREQIRILSWLFNTMKKAQRIIMLLD